VTAFACYSSLAARTVHITGVATGIGATLASEFAAPTAQDPIVDGGWT
jgi:hypothetical protein